MQLQGRWGHAQLLDCAAHTQMQDLQQCSGSHCMQAGTRETIVVGKHRMESEHECVVQTKLSSMIPQAPHSSTSADLF